jgi:hypothetical protein
MYAIREPGDYESYGKRKRLTARQPALIVGDCSGGCKWFHTLSAPTPSTGAWAAIPRVTVPGSSHLSIKVALSLSRSGHVWRQTIQKRDSEYLFLAGLFHGMRGPLSSSEESNTLQRP